MLPLWQSVQGIMGYGANRTIKMVEGVVVDVIINWRDPAKKAVTEVVADYDIGGGSIKRVAINI
jgi:hypothetical protein